MDTNTGVEFRDGRTIHRAVICIPKEECDWINGLGSYRSEDGLVERLGYDEGTVAAYGVTFEDGTIGDARLIAYDDSFGVEFTLYDEEMRELGLSDVCDRIDLTHEFPVGSEDYVLEVRRWDEKPGDVIRWVSPDEAYDDEECEIEEIEVDARHEVHFRVHPVDDSESSHMVHSRDCRPLEVE